MSEEQEEKRPDRELLVKHRSATADEFVQLFARNVSAKGLFIRTPEPLPIGSRLRFKVLLAGGEPILEGVGAVAWRRTPEQADSAPAGVGLRFEQLDDRSRRIVDRMLATRAGAASRFDHSVTMAVPAPDGSASSAPPGPRLRRASATVVTNKRRSVPSASASAGAAVDPPGGLSVAGAGANASADEPSSPRPTFSATTAASVPPVVKVGSVPPPPPSPIRRDAAGAAAPGKLTAFTKTQMRVPQVPVEADALGLPPLDPAGEFAPSIAGLGSPLRSSAEAFAHYTPTGPTVARGNRSTLVANLARALGESAEAAAQPAPATESAPPLPPGVASAPSVQEQSGSLAKDFASANSPRQRAATMPGLFTGGRPREVVESSEAAAPPTASFFPPPPMATSVPPVTPTGLPEAGVGAVRRDPTGINVPPPVGKLAAAEPKAAGSVGAPTSTAVPDMGALAGEPAVDPVALAAERSALSGLFADLEQQTRQAVERGELQEAPAWQQALFGPPFGPGPSGPPAGPPFGPGPSGPPAGPPFGPGPSGPPAGPPFGPDPAAAEDEAAAPRGGSPLAPRSSRNKAGSASSVPPASSIPVPGPEARRGLFYVMLGLAVLAVPVIAFVFVRDAADSNADLKDAQSEMISVEGPPERSVGAALHEVPAAAPVVEHEEELEISRVTIQTVPPEAEIWRDDVRVGTAPVTLELERGQQVVVRARKPGFAEASQSLLTKKSGSARVELRLERLSYVLRVQTEPAEAQVTFLGKQGTSPAEFRFQRLEAPRRIEVRKVGFRPTIRRIEADQFQEQEGALVSTLQITLQPAGSSSLVAPPASRTTAQMGEDLIPARVPAIPLRVGRAAVRAPAPPTPPPEVPEVKAGARDLGGSP